MSNYKKRSSSLGQERENQSENGQEPVNDEKQESSNGQWVQGLSLFYRVSGWVVAPLILALLAGRWLDQRYQTEPWLLLGLTLFAFFISMWKIIQESSDFIKKIEDEAQEAKRLQKNQSQEIRKREEEDFAKSKDKDDSDDINSSKKKNSQ